MFPWSLVFSDGSRAGEIFGRPDFSHSSAYVLLSGDASPYVFRFVRQLYLKSDDQLS
jgi:hypothetical protein